MEVRKESIFFFKFIYSEREREREHWRELLQASVQVEEGQKEKEFQTGSTLLVQSPQSFNSPTMKSQSDLKSRVRPPRCPGVCVCMYNGLKSKIEYGDYNL